MDWKHLDTTTLFTEFCDRGDSAAFDAFVTRVRPGLRRIGQIYSRDQSDVDDILQSTLTALIEQADRFDRKRSVRAWLQGICVREARKVRRRVFRRPDPDRLQCEESAIDAAAQAAEQEMVGRVLEAVSALDGLSQRIFTLYLFRGLAPSEIGAELGIPPSTVRSRISRGLVVLRQRLGYRL